MTDTGLGSLEATSRPVTGLTTGSSLGDGGPARNASAVDVPDEAVELLLPNIDLRFRDEVLLRSEPCDEDIKFQGRDSVKVEESRA